MNKTMRWMAFCIFLTASAWAGSPLRPSVRFSITNDAGLGSEWFVVGNHPDLGAWNPAKAIKLVYSTSNIWWGDIGVQAGTALEYKFVKRLTSATLICSETNAVWWPDGANLQAQVPAEPAAPFSGKRVEFYSDMTNVNLVYSMLASASFSATGAWSTVAMTKIGPGLRAGEWRHVAEGVGTEGEWMRFTFNGRRNGADTWEGAWDGQDYWTPLDAMIVRDRQVFNYLPPSNEVSANRVISTNVGSSVAGIAGRDVRIYLPRGYTENTTRRYPVVYMSDGQNVFLPSDSAVSWGAETTADAEIKGGRMRETIIVGVPCASDRTIEYLPHMDTNSGKKGKANLYADYLVHNVRPTIDTHFRTKNDRGNTGCIGSSSGGLLSMYLGTWTNVFGLVGAASGVYNDSFCPNYMAWLESARPHEAKVWMDVGTGETNLSGTDLYQSNFDLYWYLMGFGYVPNADLRFMIGCGQDHNEAAWASRLPEIYRFLLDVREELNGLLPLAIKVSGPVGEVKFPVYKGTAYAIESTGVPTNSWGPFTNWARETKPWSERTAVLPTNITGYYRVKGN
jgi:predicted alpha/beta superfamily hydrolase